MCLCLAVCVHVHATTSLSQDRQVERTFGAMYAKKGFGPWATLRSHDSDMLPTTAVV
jgi:hypothetical protein